MKKNILFIFLFTIIALFVGYNGVSAKVYCDYGDYKLEYKDGEFTVYKNGFTSDGYTADFEVTSESECPATIYIVVDRSNTVEISNSSSSGGRSVSLNRSGNTKVSCGNVTGIPKKIPEITSLIFNIIQIIVPIILVVIGSIDFLKGVTAQKEEEIKKGQQIFIKRLITAAIIFFVVVFVKLLVSVISNSTNSQNIVDCIDCFISNNC